MVSAPIPKAAGIVRCLATTKVAKNRFPPSIICSATRISRLSIVCTTWWKSGITMLENRSTYMSFPPMANWQYIIYLPMTKCKSSLSLNNGLQQNCPAKKGFLL